MSPKQTYQQQGEKTKEAKRWVKSFHRTDVLGSLGQEGRKGDAEREMKLKSVIQSTLRKKRKHGCGRKQRGCVSTREVSF